MPSDIEWLADPFLNHQGETWNCWRGCTRYGIDCFFCYIERTIPLRMAGMRFDKPGIGGTTGIVYAAADVLYRPLRWRTPLIIFPNSVSDLWHEQVPLAKIADVWAVMLLASWHIFQPTTKRARRQCLALNSAAFADLVTAAVERIAADLGPRRLAAETVARARAHLAVRLPGGAMRPLPNVWVGVSVGHNQAAKTRIPYLDRTPAAVRWISAEPVVEPGFNLAAGMRIRCRDCVDGRPRVPAPDGSEVCQTCRNAGRRYATVDHIIFGGESGPAYLVAAPGTHAQTHLRELTVDHLRHLIMQARRVGITTVAVKQLGTVWASHTGAAHRKGGDPAEWPTDLRVREYPRQLAERALRIDPGNTAAVDYLTELDTRLAREAADVF